MSVSIDIRPHSTSLDMHGEPDKFTAYSLSGDIAISLSSPPSFFERRKAVRVLLQSLVVEFEGQCEMITDETGYTPFRVCTLSTELVTREPVELSNEGHEENSKPCVWNVAFNLVVPGWLPPSAVYGDRLGDIGTRYALYASATFLSIDDDSDRSWFSACCSSFRPRSRFISAPKYEIRVNRYIGATEDLSSPSSRIGSLIDYSVQAQPFGELQTGSGFPAHVLSKLRSVISVPSHIDMEDPQVPVCMRLRMQDLPEDECKRVRLIKFTAEVEQTELYRTSPSAVYKALYPLPASSEQPPHRPLREAHPLYIIYEVGLAPIPPSRETHTCTFSLLPEDTSGEHALAGDGHVFAHDAAPQNCATWFAIRMQLPVERAPHRSRSAKGGVKVLRETAASPLFVVTHSLHVAMTCAYELDGAKGAEPRCATEVVSFRIPLRFGTVQRDAPSRPLTPTDSDRPSSGLGHSFPAASLPYAQALPAYSQLFDMNGDRKIDYSVPLPAYTPRPSTDSNATTPELPEERPFLDDY